MSTFAKIKFEEDPKVESYETAEFIIKPVSFSMNLKPIDEQGRMRWNRPGTGSAAGHLGLELNRETQESMEPIERDVRHVLHVRGQPNLHPTAAAFAFAAAAADRPAPEQRLPQQLKQQRQERPPLLFLLLLL
jgi:hypothetical protein